MSENCEENKKENPGSALRKMPERYRGNKAAVGVIETVETIEREMEDGDY